MVKHLKKSVHLIVALVCSFTLFLAGAFIVPKPVTALAGPDASFTKVSFNSLGIDDGTYGYKNGGYAVNAEFSESFNKKYFVGEVNFQTTGVTLYIAGTTAGKGLGLWLTAQGYISVNFDGTSVVNLNPSRLKNTSLTTFKNNTVKLGVTFEKKSATSLEVAFYINDEHYRDTTYTVSKNVDSVLGRTVSIKANSSSNKITIKSDGEIKTTPSTTLDWITTTHFYVADGTYGYNDGNVAVKGNRIVSVNNSYFTANVKFSAAEGAAIIYGGNEAGGGRTGLKFNLSGGKLVMSDAITTSGYSKEFTAADAGITSFTETFKLGISIKNMDADNDGKQDDIQLGVWFNDTLYAEEFIYFVDFADYFEVDSKGNVGNTLAVVSDVNGSTVTLGAVAELSVTMPNPELKKITFDHFGISTGEYKGLHPAFSTTGAYSKGINNTYFSGYVTYHGASQLIYGMTGSGLVFRLNGGNFRLEHNAALITAVNFDANVAGVESFTEKFRLGISTEFVDNDADGEKDDVKLGVFFNEALYNDKYLYFNDYVGNVGDTLAIYGHTGDKLTIGNIDEFKDPVTSRPLDSSFKKFTFDTVSILDKTYTVSDGLIRGAYGESLDGACFGGTVTFSAKAGAQMLYAATAGNAGMTISLTDDGRLVLGHNAISFPTKYFLASKAGLNSFADEEFNISISTRYVDSDNDGAKDDVELGMWFNDILYADEFIYIPDYVQHMDKYIYIYCPPASAGTTITVGTRSDFMPVVIPEELNPDLKLITLNNFSIKDGVLEDSNGDDANGLVTNGAYLKSLGGTYFAFNANFSIPDKDAPISLQYAGKGDGWVGFCFEVFPDKITAGDNVGHSEKYTFYAKKCGLDSFTDKDLKIGISTEYMDLDSDGAEDDVRFGLWINDKLANNEYMNVIDYRQYIGDEANGIGAGLGIYIKPSSATVNGEAVSKHNPLKAKLSSVLIPVRFQQFGFTDNWERELEIFAGSASHGTATGAGNNSTSTSKPQSPQTGDSVSALNAVIISCVALGGIIKLGRTRG